MFSLMAVNPRISTKSTVATTLCPPFFHRQLSGYHQFCEVGRQKPLEPFPGNGVGLDFLGHLGNLDELRTAVGDVAQKIEVFLGVGVGRSGRIHHNDPQKLVLMEDRYPHGGTDPQDYERFGRVEPFVGQGVQAEDALFVLRDVPKKRSGNRRTVVLASALEHSGPKLAVAARQKYHAPVAVQKAVRALQDYLQNPVDIHLETDIGLQLEGHSQLFIIRSQFGFVANLALRQELVLVRRRNLGLDTVLQAVYQTGIPEVLHRRFAGKQKGTAPKQNPVAVRQDHIAFRPDSVDESAVAASEVSDDPASIFVVENGAVPARHRRVRQPDVAFGRTTQHGRAGYAVPAKSFPHFECDRGLHEFFFEMIADFSL